MQTFKWGGRGLYFCACMVGPLRAKLALKVIQDIDSLLFKLLGTQFCFDCGEVICRKESCSYKIIGNGMEFLKPVIRWKVGTGCSIDIFNDIWILDKSLNKCPTFVAIPERGNLTVDKLIIDGKWNVGELKILFGEDLICLVRRIHIQINKEDFPELIHQNFGCSISALAYKASAQEQSSRSYWECFKKVKLRPRVEVFW